MEKKYVRKRLPKKLAVVDQHSCTGCEACIEVCPVDCIKLVQSDILPQKFVDIDLDTCIGCELCVRLPSKNKKYDLKVCPWDAIEMQPTEQVIQDSQHHQ